MTRFALPVFAAVTLLASHSALAGIVYNFQSVSSGMTATTIAGRAEADGQNFRMSLTTGDGRLFKDGSVVLSHDGGKTISVVDLSAKTYYDLEIEELVQSASSLFGGGGMFKLSVQSPKVAVRDEGSGGTVEGYPTKKTTVDGSYDLVIDTGGQKISMHMTMKTESWTTDRIGAEYTNFLLAKGMKSGIEAIDKLMEAGGATHLGGFTLKQVVSVTMSQNGSDVTSTTTSTVSGIVMKNVPAGDFQLPAGLRKTDDPIKTMMKQVGGE